MSRSILGSPVSRAYITVVGIEPGTNVTIKTSTPTVTGGAAYPALAKNGAFIGGANLTKIYVPPPLR